MATPKQVDAIVQVAKVLYATILECGEEGAPAGILWSAYATTGMSMFQFESLLSILINVGLVKRDDSHVLRATRRF